LQGLVTFRLVGAHHDVTGVTIALTVVVLYALVAGQLARRSISAPIVLVAAGIVLGEGAIDVLHVTVDTASVRLLAELTLALLLFADASTLRLRDASRDAGLPGRLLGVGLPLTMALGALLAHLVFPVSWAEAALVACILAPTDAALGLAVVSDPAVPARVRRALSIESGLNDGIAAPFVIFFLAVVAAEEAHAHWILGGLKEIAVAGAFGAAFGALTGWLAARAKAAGWTTTLSEILVVLSVALGSYAGAVALHGNGFVAAFIAGIFFGTMATAAFQEPTTFTEDLGLFGSFAVWIIFGAVFAGPVLAGGLEARPIAYAVLSLTVIRMVPVALSLLGQHLRRETVAYMGWFGPRGLASVVFTLIVVEDLHPGADVRFFVETVTWTILLSVLAHGLSAVPLTRRYTGRISTAPVDSPELRQVAETRLRRRSLHERPVTRTPA
jgi:NhaP-type Na+/H+ or K+/H+ antiporter